MISMLCHSRHALALCLLHLLRLLRLYQRAMRRIGHKVMPDWRCVRLLFNAHIYLNELGFRLGTRPRRVVRRVSHEPHRVVLPRRRTPGPPAS